MNSIKGIFRWYFQTSFLLRILIGLIAGAILGLAVGPDVVWVKPFGDLFVRLLKMIVMPVVIFTLVVGAASVHPSQLGKIGVKSFLLYLLTSGFAVALGLLFGNLIGPGEGMQLNTAIDSVGKSAASPNLVQTLLSIIPTNPFSAITNGNMLPTIVGALFFGIGLAYIRQSNEQRIRDAGETVYRFFEGGSEIMYLVVRWVLEYAPIGVFALMALVFGKQGTAAFGPLASVTFSFYLAVIVHLIVIYGLLLGFNKLSLIKFISRGKEAIITAFVTRSSGGTLPVTMRVAKDNMGISKGVYSFTLPLGATVNMDGSAIYQGICVIFISLAIGMPLSIIQQLTVIITAVLASIGAAGVPGAGAIILLMVLESVGLKVEQGSAVAAAYAMILGIDALLDMGRTGLNVAGDLAVTNVVAKSEGQLDQRCWENKE